MPSCITNTVWCSPHPMCFIRRFWKTVTSLANAMCSSSVSPIRRNYDADKWNKSWTKRESFHKFRSLNILTVPNPSCPRACAPQQSTDVSCQMVVLSSFILFTLAACGKESSTSILPADRKIVLVQMDYSELCNTIVYLHWLVTTHEFSVKVNTYY